MKVAAIVELQNGEMIPLYGETVEKFAERYNEFISLSKCGDKCMMIIGSTYERAENVSRVREASEDEIKQLAGASEIEEVRKDTGLEDLEIDQIDD